MSVLPRTLWLIGASTGIGRETALQLARAGVTVVASARSAGKLASLAEEAPPGRIVPLACDAADPESLKAAYAAAKAVAGPIEALLFAAATWTPETEQAVALAPVRHVFEVNFFGCLAAIEAVTPDMMVAGRGRIAVISSVAGFRGLPRALAYGSSKAAMTHMAETLRLQLRRHGIIVQVVHPGFVRTPLTDKNDFPMPFLMEPDQAAARIVAGLQSDRFEITFPRRFTMLLKLLRCLPYAWYFPAVRRATGMR